MKTTKIYRTVIWEITADSKTHARDYAKSIPAGDIFGLCGETKIIKDKTTNTKPVIPKESK